MMHDEATCSFRPRVGSLNNPAFCKYNKPVVICVHGEQIRLIRTRPTTHIPICRVADHVNSDPVTLRNRLRAAPSVTRIDMQHFQRRVFLDRHCDDWVRTIPILNIRSCHTHSEQQTQRVDHQVSFAPFDFFAGIVSVVAALRGTACGLRIQNGCGRRAWSQVNYSSQTDQSATPHSLPSSRSRSGRRRPTWKLRRYSGSCNRDASSRPESTGRCL